MPAPSASHSPASPTFSENSHSGSSSGSSSADLPPLYLKHILTCPPSDALPLRNMYASNVLAHQRRPRGPSPAASFENKMPRTRSPSIPGREVPPLPDGPPTREPTTIEAMHYMPSPAQALPPSFITSFVRRVFTEDLCLVDFTQALTAMDYLKVLDDRKRRELAAALRRLDVDAEMLGRSREELRSVNPRLADWISAIDDKGKKVEALYTQVYIGLRRWTLINEMRLTPFSKQNCIAMLNALYPSHYPALPTVQLTETILNAQRNAFFRYIQAVEKSGRGVLASLELSGRRPGSINGWPVVRDLVDAYLTRTNDIIEECMAIKGAEAFGGRRADSGVSFGSDSSRPSTGTGHTSWSDKPLPPQPTQTDDAPLKKKKSRLESFARELRRIRSRSADHKDEVDLRQAAAKGSSLRGLRKMRSTTALNREFYPKKEAGATAHSRGNSSDRGALYEVDDAHRERLLREARLDKENRAPKRSITSPELPLAARIGPVSPDQITPLPIPWGPRDDSLPHPPPMPWAEMPEPRLGEPAMPAELSA